MWTSRKPDVQQAGPSMKGRVCQLWRGRFCGLIRTRDGRHVFFHGRDFASGAYNDVEVGGLVSFELIDDRVSGPRAGRVRPAQAALEPAKQRLA